MLPWLVVAAVAAYTGYQIFGAIYNIYFHPLASFPGPKLWIAFPVLRRIFAATGNLDRELIKFHQRFGEVVRFTDDSLSFTTAQAWKDIYGYGHGSKQWPKEEFRPPGSVNNILFCNDVEHARFRKALAPAFSEQSLRLQEDLIKGYVDILIASLREEADKGQNADMTMWYNLTTFDIISDLAFGEPSNCLKNKAYTEYIITIFKFLQVVPMIQLAKFYPSIWKTISLFIGKSVQTKRENLFKIGTDTAMKRKNDRSKDGRGDFMEALLRHSEMKDPISDAELGSNAHILFMAGSETSSTLLAGTTYYMLKTPGVIQNAMQEVRSAFENQDDITFTSASAKIPYTLACLEEGLRMYPPVPTCLVRTTPEPATISGYAVPAGTHVGVHQLAANMSHRNFSQPDSFKPERWMPELNSDEKSPFYSDNRDARQPFSIGPRNCIGMNLAFAEMRQILARVLWNFDLELVDKEQHWAKQKTYVVWAKEPLLCHIRARKSV
ncbi:hypothetical protein LTR64_006745 [Lithohypha guttulata]|uniref:uncharacterized protein n=1 Tax=Lithohypha guttulata TaxID=1690604 RepID=UPI002DDE553F|nr:hypothetical protein LTR51_004696 [Lithohypha guttulata]